MIVVLHIIILCRFTLRSYTANVLPASYAWSTYTGPVSGEVHEVKSPYAQLENTDDESDPSYGRDYVAKPDYSFSYGVENPNTGDSHGHSETRDGSTVTGEYSVMEPDGILRRVLYTADPKNGFRASIRFVRPDGEEINRDHGYNNKDQLSESHSSPSPEYESNDEDERYESSPPSPSSLNYGYDDGYNNNEINDNSDDEDDSSNLSFKFPLSSPSPFIKTTDSGSDFDDYDSSDKYYHLGTEFDGPKPFSSSSFGLPSSPSPFRISSFNRRPSSSSFDRSSPYDPPSSPYDPPSSQYDPSSSPLLFGLQSPAFGRSVTSSPSVRSDIISKRPTVIPCTPPPSLKPNRAIHHIKTSGHSNGFGFPSDEDNDGVSPFRSSLANFNGHNDDVRESYESDDDNDVDPADTITDVNRFPSVLQPSRPSTSTLPSAITSTPSPPLRRSTSWKRSSSSLLRPIAVAELLSPSSPSVMMPIEPTIIDIDD